MTPSRFAMFTVPHSGTRYIADTFDNSGIKAAQCMPRGADGRTTCGPDGLMWAHWAVYGKNPHKYQTMPPEQCFSVVRDPVATWATHAKFILNPDLSPERIYGTGEDKKIMLEQHYRYQERYKDQVSYWHKVEDPLKGLEEWAGVQLQPGAPSHSTPTPLKQAVKDKDIKRIVELTDGSDFWEWFVNEITPRIQPLYEGQFGYDFWWTNG